MKASSNRPRARARLATPNLDPATQKIWAEEHALAVTVAGMARDDILAALRDGLSDVIAGKLSREEWLAGARQRLIKAGYWREESEKGGITPSRLQLIFDTNTANAYHGGRWQRLEERRETHPYLMYLTKRDHRVRPEHRAWEGLILPIDHPFWQTHFPPNGFRCRCAVLGVTQAEYDQLRRDGGQFAGGTVKFDNDVDADNESLDPGFAYNPGIPGSRAAALQRLAEEKAARQAAKAATSAAATAGAPSNVPSTGHLPESDNPNTGLEHLPETVRTSMEEAVQETNALKHSRAARAKRAAANAKVLSLFNELRAMLDKGAGFDERQAKFEEYERAKKARKRLREAYTTNCTCCVIAYELRRRGFDVYAAARNNVLAHNWERLFSGQKVVDVGDADKLKAVSQLEDELLRYGEGSRSIVRVGWDEEDSGHAFIAEVRGGKVVYVDPQSGDLNYTSWQGRFWSLHVARIDDKQVNPDFLRRAVKARRHTRGKG